MQRRRKIISILTNAAVFIILEIAAFTMLRHNGELQNIWISKLGHAVSSSLWKKNEELRSYFRLHEQNEALIKENIRLSQQLRNYQLSSPHSVPDSLIDDDFSYQSADIFKISRNKQHNYIIINKGYEDGVYPQSGIITPNGVIGIVTAVERHYAFALSFMNTEISVSARIGREGGTGLLFWDGKNQDGATLKGMSLNTRMEAGDTVWTSGYSAIFPKDIPLGVIVDSNIINGSIYECKVRLFEDFSSLKYVTVVSNIGRDEIMNLEQLDQNE